MELRSILSSDSYTIRFGSACKNNRSKNNHSRVIAIRTKGSLPFEITLTSEILVGADGQSVTIAKLL